MATSEGAKLVVPQMGVVEQVVVLEWLIEDGANVQQGQKVVVVETDKADTELEAPVAGRLSIVTPAGEDEVAVGTTLALIV